MVNLYLTSLFSFDLIKKKYKNKILNLNGWRTFLEIDKVLTANKEL